jgi:hypothetical protein
VRISLLLILRSPLTLSIADHFPTFGASLSQFTRHLLPPLLLALLVLSYVQSYLLASQSASYPGALPPAWIADALLGNSALVWAPLMPLLVCAMVAVVTSEYVVLWAVVAGLAGFVRLVQTKSPTLLRERLRYVLGFPSVPLESWS